MRVVLDGEQVVKEADSEADRSRLEGEARALRACAHPGVVALLASEGGDPPDRLVLSRIGGRPLADAGPRLPLEVLAGLTAAIGATLADLHDLGWVHGAVSADHVLLDEQGRPVLCGFGRASRPSSPSELAVLAAGDVKDLAVMLSAFLPPHPDRRVARLLAGCGGRRLGRPPSARRLARRVVDLVPDARLESPAPQKGEGKDGPGSRVPDGTQPGRPAFRRSSRPSRPFRPGGRAAAAGGAVAAVLVAVLIIPVLLGPSSPARAPAPAPPAGTVPRPDGRYVLSDPAGGRLITVMGRWGCGGVRPAVLDLADGWVWIFGGWPGPGASLRASPVARRPGAVGLAVEQVRDGCDDLLVMGRSGSRIPVPGAGTARGS